MRTRSTIAELGRRPLGSRRRRARAAVPERAGVIAGYRAPVPKALGWPIAVIVRIRPATRQLHKIPEIAAEIPEIVECRRITGEDCYVLDLHLRSMDDQRSSTASSPTGRRQRRSCTRRRSPAGRSRSERTARSFMCAGLRSARRCEPRFAKTSRSAPAPRRLSKETFAIPAVLRVGPDDQRRDERVSPSAPSFHATLRWIDRWLAACSTLAELEYPIR